MAKRTTRSKQSQQVQDFREAAEVAKMFGDATRLKIVAHLKANGESSVGDICDALSIPQPSASHHLGLLRRSGIVANVRQGKSVIYSLSKADNEAVADLKTVLSAV